MKYNCIVCNSPIRFFKEVSGNFYCEILENSSPDFTNLKFEGDVFSIGVECGNISTHMCGYVYDHISNKIVKEKGDN